MDLVKKRGSEFKLPYPIIDADPTDLIIPSDKQSQENLVNGFNTVAPLETPSVRIEMDGFKSKPKKTKHSQQQLLLPTLYNNNTSKKQRKNQVSKHPNKPDFLYSSAGLASMFGFNGCTFYNNPSNNKNDYYNNNIYDSRLFNNEQVYNNNSTNNETNALYPFKSSYNSCSFDPSFLYRGYHSFYTSLHCDTETALKHYERYYDLQQQKQNNNYYYYDFLAQQQRNRQYYYQQNNYNPEYKTSSNEFPSTSPSTTTLLTCPENKNYYSTFELNKNNAENIEMYDSNKYTDFNNNKDKTSDSVQPLNNNSTNFSEFFPSCVYANSKSVLSTNSNNVDSNNKNNNNHHINLKSKSTTPPIYPVYNNYDQYYYYQQQQLYFNKLISTTNSQNNKQIHNDTYIQRKRYDQKTLNSEGTEEQSSPSLSPYCEDYNGNEEKTPYWPGSCHVSVVKQNGGKNKTYGVATSVIQTPNKKK